MVHRHIKAAYFRVPGVVRKVIILVIGMTILLIGLAMIILPGPAILVIPLGLVILAIEFVWAKRMLNKVNKTKDKLLKR